MKKLINPQELRRVEGNSESIGEDSDLYLRDDQISKSVEEDKGFIDLIHVIKRALRHKKIFFSSFALLYVSLTLLYGLYGSWYEKRVTVNINNSNNNSFFKYLDESLGGDGSKGADDPSDYSNKAITSFKSDAFLIFCYESALKDSEVEKIFDLDLKGKDTQYNQKTREKLIQFFETTVIVSPFEKPSGARAPKPGFVIKTRYKNPLFLENSPEKISKIMNDYLFKVNSEELSSAQKIIKVKMEEIQKKLAEANDKRLKISQSIPLVDRASIYALQNQLQSSKIAISGNKVLEARFKESLADIENKISAIRGVGSDEGNPYALNQELASLTNQKSELKAQGVESESFKYKNIVQSLTSTLKALEDTDTKIKIVQKNESSSFYSTRALELSKSLDEINLFLNEKTGNVPPSDLEKSLTVNFPENSDPKITSKQLLPVVNQETVRELKSQLLSVKKSIEGNKFFEERLSGKITEIERKLDSVDEARSNLEKNYYSTSIQDISNMAYLQQQLKLQGVDDDSFVARKLSETLKKATSDLKKDKGISLNTLKLEDLYPPNESSLFEQRESLEKIKSENSFYEAKISEISKSLDELTFLLNDRAEKESKLAELDDSTKNDRINLDLLNRSLLKMDLGDFKALRKLQFSFEPIEEKNVFPVSVFLIFSLVLSVFGALSLSYLVEILNPCLNTVKSLEELGSLVLAGVPSVNSNLFQEGFQIDGVTDLSYLRMGIRLENMLSSLNGKIILISSNEDSLKSAIISLNLGAFFGSTGKKVLILESDLIHNSIAKITGAPLTGGVSELYLHKEKVELYPYRVNEGLDVISGDPLQVPSVYRLASQNFKELLSDLSLQYDYIFLHTRPCLEAPDASDLSRYAEVGIVCCDAESMNIQKLEKLNQEMKAFLSKKTCFILENAKDIQVELNKKIEPKKVAA